MIVGAFGAVCVYIIPPGVDSGIRTGGGAGGEPGRTGLSTYELESKIKHHDVLAIISVAAVAERLVEMAFVVAIDAGW